MGYKKRKKKYSINILNYNYLPFETIEYFAKVNYPTNAFEVVIWDDGSTEEIRIAIQQFIKSYPSIDLVWQNENIGRAKMRQKLLSSFNGEWGIFMDADIVPLPDIFKTLDQHLIYADSVYSGQLLYPTAPPKPDLLLHWKYGTHRETRSKKGFKTGFFALHHSMKNKLAFDTTISHYGHEDTVFGFQLKQQQIKVERLPCLAIHTGLHPRSEFIQHQLQAIDNLIIIKEKYPNLQTSLSKWGDIFSKYSIARWILTLPYLKRIYYRMLNKENPKLWALDLLKLNHYILTKRRKYF